MAEISYPYSLDPDAKDFIGQLLAKDPNERPRFDGIAGHAWMSGLDFDAEKLKSMSVPHEWVVQHATNESKAKPRSMRRNSTASHHGAKSDLSLNQLIEDICVQMVDVSGDEVKETAAARWMCEPSANTLHLFRNWSWTSESALQLESSAANSHQSKLLGGLSRRKMRRATQG